MNILYKIILKTEKTSSKVIITLFAIFLSIICFCLAVHFIDEFKKANKYYYLIIHIFFVLCSYYLFKVFAIVMYSKTYNVKEKILSEIDNGEIFTKWCYTKDESLSLKKDYALQNKENKKALYFLFLITAGLPCLIIIMSIKSASLLASLEMIYTIITAFGIILLSSTDLNNYKRVLKEENISVIFTKTGYLISNSYVGAFYTIHRRLINIKYDTISEKIIFTFSIFSPGVDGGLDTKHTTFETFPVPKRYENDVHLLKKKTPKHNSF